MLKPFQLKHILCIGFIIFSISNVNAQKMIHKEILGKPTDHTISIQAIFDTAVQVRILYGFSNNFTDQTPWQFFNTGQTAEVELTALSADTLYYYELQYRKPNDNNIFFNPIHQFRTQRAKGKSFTFVIQADPHLDEQSDTAVYNRCLKNQLEDQPDFMIDLGDFLMTDKLRNASKKVPKDTIPYRCHLLRNYYENICHSVPLYIALGNHEGEAGWNLTGTADNMAVWSSIERQKYFLNPKPNTFYTGDTTMQKFIGQRGNYYAWEWGDALFIVLDPYWYTKVKPDSLNGWRWSLGKTQYDWLKTTLEQSKANYKFVFAHQIIGGDPDGRGGVEYADWYEWGGLNRDGSNGFAQNRPGWYKPIKDLLKEHRVTIFFHGHDHFFGKQDKNCLVYQECPQPSHPNFTSVTYAYDYGYHQGQILPNSGHIRVKVAPAGVKVEYVRVYLPRNETPNRHNKDISASYYIGQVNCYDSTQVHVPMILNQNYLNEHAQPNPFQTSTNIQWQMVKTETLFIKVFNSTGQLVSTLVNGHELNPGAYQVEWNGNDQLGNPLPSGNYFYTISNMQSNLHSGTIILNR